MPVKSFFSNVFVLFCYNCNRPNPSATATQQTIAQPQDLNMTATGGRREGVSAGEVFFNFFVVFEADPTRVQIQLGTSKHNRKTYNVTAAGGRREGVSAGEVACVFFFCILFFFAVLFFIHYSYLTFNFTCLFFCFNFFVFIFWLGENM